MTIIVGLLVVAVLIYWARGDKLLEEAEERHLEEIEELERKFRESLRKD